MFVTVVLLIHVQRYWWYWVIADVKPFAHMRLTTDGVSEDCADEQLTA